MPSLRFLKKKALSASLMEAKSKSRRLESEAREAVERAVCCLPVII